LTSTQAQVKQIAEIEIPYSNSDKTVSLTFIQNSCYQIYSQITFQSMQNPGFSMKTNVLFYDDECSFKLPKPYCRNGNTHPIYERTVCYCYNGIHVARNSSHDTFHAMEIKETL